MLEFQHLDLTPRFDDTLFPGFHLREAMGSIGVRSTFAEGLFWDFDVGYGVAWTGELGVIDDATKEALDFSDELWHGLEPPFEALFGWLEDKDPKPDLESRPVFRPSGA